MNGREGLQAARAADFTLPRFSFLVPLCLVHGRYSLHRTAFIAKFAFYKSIFLCSLQVWAMRGRGEGARGVVVCGGLCICGVRGGAWWCMVVHGSAW